MTEVPVLDGFVPPSKIKLPVKGELGKKSIEEAAKTKEIPGYALWHYAYGWCWIPGDGYDYKNKK